MSHSNTLELVLMQWSHRMRAFPVMCERVPSIENAHDLEVIGAATEPNAALWGLTNRPT